ncbi:LptF/LptG family permease [Mucilaginibacter sp. KACC 22063]|uniref:LptF/LptG family permease n=1 Tax=Mucilaginibacter sp. KACC 22063 TaxID=3025666 RepID=UPI002365251C|nr:LptF/LptG family permease [Mucilaginibacter sp. KACC 22063]WDF54114.1 LptF/LptG family permease [Mucilaginibacter sp. KACC 22063]
MKALFGRYLKVIDWYIIRKYLGTFSFTIALFMVIIVVFDVSEHLDNFLKSNAPLSAIVFQYYAGYLPFYTNLLLPLINFLAVIFFTAKMANQTEIVPILSGKASFNRFLRPYFFSATLIFIVFFFANIYLIPFTNKLDITFENHYFNDVDPTKSEVHMQLDKDTYVYLQSFDNTIHTGYDFVLEKFDGDEMKQKLVANRIVYDSLKRVWSIQDYNVRYVNGLKESFVYNGIKKDTVLDMKPADFEAHDNVYRAMGMAELNKNIQREQLRGTGALTDMLFEKYRRFVYPLSSYVLMVIGVAISSRKVRGGIGLPLGIGIFLCFTYIVVDRFAFVFSIKGGMPPIIAVFIPNVLFGILGYYLLIKAPK